jgi:hypothetical protein
MPSFSRGSIPQNYYDVTVAKLLKQPEPQYLFGRWFLDAVGTALPMPAGIGLDGRQAPKAGAPFTNYDADRLELARSLPSELMAISRDFGKTPGNTIRINRPAYQNTTYTLASRQVMTSTPISTTPITFGTEQTSLTLIRYGGPYDSVNSRVAPFAIESFDANMGVHSASDEVGNQLMRDFHKFLDAVYITLSEAGAAIYPDSMASDNDAVTAGSFPLTLEQISRTWQLMTEQNLPRFADGKLGLALTPKQIKQLFHDPETLQQSTYHPEFNLLFPNYFRTVSNFHIFECTTLLSPLNSSSVAVDHGIAFAPSAYMGGMGRPPKIAATTDDNFGEQVKVIWLADLAFGLADSRFIRSVRSA